MASTDTATLKSGEIVERIIDARAQWLKNHAGKPSKVFLDIRGMHDLWDFIEEIGLDFAYRVLDTGERPSEVFMGLEIQYDPMAVLPRVE